MTGPIDTLKVYGERNNGTTFVHDMLVNNFVARALDTSINDHEVARRAALVDGIDSFVLRCIVEDRFETAIYPRLVEDAFGWKHASPPIEFLKTVPHRTATTLFVVVVKHPVSWALSFQMRPYHSYFRYRRMSFSDFVRHPFIPTGRDNVDAVLYNSALAMYGAKVDGYRRLRDLGVPFELVRYEDMLTDISGFLKRLEVTYGLARRHAHDVIQDHSTKGDETTLADYRRKYAMETVRNLVTQDDYDFIIEAFGKDRLAWLGYPQ